jgi:transcriptional regulator with XRE-family HTH domain
MSDEQRNFSRRLAEAMRAKGYDPKPGVLHKLFNSHYQGRSVAFSTASKWLRGMTLPEQDKLQVLADLFGVDPQLLRFGRAGKGVRVAEAPHAWPAGVGVPDRQAIEAYLALPIAQRQLLRELIKTLGESAKPKSR